MFSSIAAVRKSAEGLSVARLEPEAIPLYEKYRGSTTAFSFGERYLSRTSFSGALSSGLKVVGAAVGVEGLGFYYARHSWATIAANACGIPVDVVDECLAHADSRMAKVYIKKDWERVYRANRAVLDALQGSATAG